MITVKKLSLNFDEIWQEVQEVQAKARKRKLEEADVHLFLYLCNQAIKVCEKYGVEKNAIDVEITGGAVCNNYGYNAETTILRCEAEMVQQSEKGYVPTGEIQITCIRGYAKHRPWGEYKPHARIAVNAKHSARKAMKEAGLIEGRDQYARIYRA